MNQRGNKYRSKYKTPLILTLLVVLFVSIQNITAQINSQEIPVTEDPSQTDSNTDSLQAVSPKQGPVQLEPLIFELDPEKEDAEQKRSFFQFLKFKENRERKEKERIQQAVKEMMMLDEEAKTKNRINIEPGTVNTIETELNVIKDSITDVNEEVGAVKDAVEEVEMNVDKLEELESKRSTPIVNDKPTLDYFDELAKYNKGKLGADFQAEVMEHSLMVERIGKETDSIFAYLQQREKCRPITLDARPEANDSIIIGDSIQRFYACLKKRSQLIGWHNARDNDRSENYNFNLLTILNYDGLRLKANGTLSKPPDIQISPIPKVIERANKANCKVYITVENDNPRVLTQFLSSEQAQQNLLRELWTLKDTIIQGVNIHFSNLAVRDRDKFRSFVEKINHSLYRSDKDAFEIAITMPGIVNNQSKVKIGAYDIERLNKVVNYFWILTDQLVNRYTDIPKPNSPLKKSLDGKSYSLSSNLDFYSKDRNIPLSKLIFTISTTGLEWKVDKTSEKLEPKTTATELSLKQILSNYKYHGDDLDLFAAERYDPDMATAYIDIKKRLNSLDTVYRRVWYDDVRSIYDKLNWTIENKMGGISLRYLNFDEGDHNYSEYLQIWKVIGAVNMEIEKIPIEVMPLKYNLTWRDYMPRFVDDLRWASLNLLVPDKSNIPCDYEDHKNQIDSILRGKIVILKSMDLANIKDFDTEVEGFDQFLDTKEQCLYLYVRWRSYARILLAGTFFFLLISILIYYKGLLYYKRFPPKNRKTIYLLRVLIVIFLGLSYVSFVLFIYLEPSIGLIGGGSNRQVPWTVLLMPGLVMFVLVVFYTIVTKGTKTVPID